MVAALSWAARLKAGLARTREVLNTPVPALLARRRVDESLYEELEAALLQADCGVAATQAIVSSLRRKKLEDGEALRRALKDALVELLLPLERKLEITGARPFVIMLAGVNGSGKTTSIGKLAHWLRLQGGSVLLAARRTKCSSCSTPTPGRTRSRRSRPSTTRSASPASSSPSSTAPPRAGWFARSRGSGRFRFSSSA